MANKSIEDLYSSLFAIQESIQDATQLAAEAANLAGMFGGEISRVVTEQLNKYFIPAVSKYAEDGSTPGAIAPIITFLDSVPLAMTREEVQPDSKTPPPQVEANLVQPPVEKEAPAEGSFADQVKESKNPKIREGYNTDTDADLILYIINNEVTSDITKADAKEVFEGESDEPFELAMKDALRRGWIQDKGGWLTLTPKGTSYITTMEEKANLKEKVSKKEVQDLEAKVKKNKTAWDQYSEWKSKYGDDGFSLKTADGYDLSNARSKLNKLIQKYELKESVEDTREITDVPAARTTAVKRVLADYGINYSVERVSRAGYYNFTIVDMVDDTEWAEIAAEITKASGITVY